MLIKSTNIEEIVTLISNHVLNNTVLISVGEHTNVNVTLLINHLNKQNIQFIGGVFPKVIHDDMVFGQGIVVSTLKNVKKIIVTKNISEKTFVIPEMEFNTNKEYSLITYVDGLTSNISYYLSALYKNFGMQTNYFGGGAGSLSLIQKPCVFCNEGFFQDAAISCVIQTASKIGVKHGWYKIDGPFIVTKAEGNIIKEINWENPFELYKRVVKKHSNKKINDTNFFEIAKGYPFGIVKDNSECIVRDPLMVNESGELICVGELEENTLIDILNGNETTLIEAAKKATKESLKLAINPKKAIIIDCISRILFLEDRFDIELNTITSTIKEDFPEISISGALTLGEISSYGEGFIEFYNKTVVIGLFD